MTMSVFTRLAAALAIASLPALAAAPALASDSSVTALIAQARAGNVSDWLAHRLSATERGDALSELAAADEPDALVLAIGAGLEPDAINSAGTDALISAIAADSSRSVETLLRAGASPTLPTRFGPPGQFAASVGSAEIVALFARSGALDIGTRLLQAAQDDDVATLAPLLRAGASPDSQGPGQLTPLMAAVLDGAHNAVAALLAAGAQTELVDAHGLTALAMAVMADDPGSVNALLAAHADPSAKISGTPILSLA
ncbi:MAG TPA: ankyrin repeat domain-containing protein, partial [Devosia sp.]|nr:ankyrin repeat domain-containing protein [Devosia sp.]